MQNLEDEVRGLMILQSQVSVSYLDLCVSGHLKQLKELNFIYEDISNYLLRRGQVSRRTRLSESRARMANQRRLR